MDAVMYLRSARLHPAHLLLQRERCEVVARRRGYDLAACYADLGHSRLALRTLTEEAKENGFEAVFIYGLSRIGRTLTDFTSTVDAFCEAGCTIYDASTGAMFDPKSITAHPALATLRTLAELDAERIDRQRRTRRALTR